MANDSLEELAEILFGNLQHMQDRILTSSGVQVLPKIASSHFAGHFVAAGWCNRCGLHAAGLGLARQVFEATSVIEVGFSGADGLTTLERWAAGRITAGGLRKWLEENSWPRYPSVKSGLSWAAFMASLGKALQPYAHFSPELLQWNMNMIQPPGDSGPGVVAIGPSYDRVRSARIQLVRGALLWTLGTVMIQHDAQSLPRSTVERVGNLGDEIFASEWWISDDWSDVLIAHIWDA